MEKLLDVENVSISFIQYTKGLNQRDLKVITDLTLDISEGEILAVLGSSGSGKSLLAHAIFGILPENANLNGKIKYKGKELSQEDKEELRGKEITLIPQSVNFLDPLMKISDQAIGHTESEEEKKQKSPIGQTDDLVGAFVSGWARSCCLSVCMANMQRKQNTHDNKKEN